MWLEDFPAEIVRAKGIMWLATRDMTATSFSQADPPIQMGPAGYWIVALPEAERELILEEEKEVLANWDPTWSGNKNCVHRH